VLPSAGRCARAAGSLRRVYRRATAARPTSLQRAVLAVEYVVRSSQDGWVVQREGKKTPESTHRKKDVAVRRGRSLAKRAGGMLKVKGKNGKIQAKRNYAA
jgi:hypothetical protein